MELHPKPKQPIQINRPLIIAIVAVVVTVLLLAIIAALTTSDRIKSTPTSALKMSTDKFVVSSELSGLPGSYSDVEGIKRYITDSSGSQLAALVKRFDHLQEEYYRLREQMASQKSAPQKARSDPKTEEAKKSGLSFPGLGSKVENMVGGGPPGSSSDKTSPFASPDSKETLSPTTQQGEFYRKQAEDEQKLAVMKAKDNPNEIYDMHPMHKPIATEKTGTGKYHEIQAGTLIPATLITGVDTTFEGTLIAQVRSNIYDTITGKYLLVPKGSKLLGDYVARIAAGQRRVLIAFNRIIRPDGSSILLGKSPGTDEAGQSGIEGNVDNHWARLLGSATISAILSAGAGMAGGNSSDYNPTVRQRAFGSMGQSISNAGQALFSRDANIQPTIKLYPGRQFDVTVKRDMILEPYNTRRY